MDDIHYEPSSYFPMRSIRFLFHTGMYPFYVFGVFSGIILVDGYPIK